MAKRVPESPEETKQQSIEELQKRYQSLHNAKIAAETNLENARKRLDELKQEARSRYQTDDLAELQQKLADMKQENERKRSAYQADLDRIQHDLAEVQLKFGTIEETETPAAG